MAELTLAAYLRAANENAYNNLVNDLDALEEDKAAGTPHEALRPSIKLIAECGSVNGLVASMIATGAASMPTPEQREAFFASITTRDEALAVLKENTEKLYAAIDAVAPDTWGDTLMTPLGPRTRAAAAGLAGMHMMYHDGQLNYIHLLNGDTEMHWK